MTIAARNSARTKFSSVWRTLPLSKRQTYGFVFFFFE